jgi:hypothetical protein
VAPDCWSMTIGTCVCHVWSQHLVSRNDVVDAGGQVGWEILMSTRRDEGPAKWVRANISPPH